jgi:prolyl-tRNA editing enzyme YbaK/EbsC (Cys-tRNA(Pro) deacylase)
VIDIRLLYHGTVLCAAGDHRHSLLIDPRDLFRLAEPRVADICEHDVGEHRFSDVPHV